MSLLVLPTVLEICLCSDLSPIYFVSLWSFCYFVHSLYLVFLISTVLYLLPQLPNFTSANNFQSPSFFTSVEGVDLLRITLTPILLLSIYHFSWSGPTLTAWFGHLIFAAFQFKVTYLVFASFLLFLTGALTILYFSSTLVYDFLITTVSFFFWLWMIFFTNNLFTFIFFLELLSSLVTLLLVTSTFSSNHFYNNQSYSKHVYFHSSTPTAFLQTLMFFFWITLIASLTLFIFLTAFYSKFLTFDWCLVDSLLWFLVTTSSNYSLAELSFVWLLILLCILIKCGIAPLYLWKPSFFRGMNLVSLFFYINVYYFSLFFFFLYVLFFYLNELFFFKRLLACLTTHNRNDLTHVSSPWVS